MLQKIYRLPASTRIKQPTFYKTLSFSLRYASNNLEINRYGFIVKKTIDKRAVHRNRLKRVFRSCIEEMKPEIKTGHDMLFSLEKGIIGKERGEIYKELTKLLTDKALHR